jgi:DNA-binding XRE family transcriptional regulator
MLAVVKKPHIELSINGDNIKELVKYISKKYDIEILDNNEDYLVDIEETDFGKKMNINRAGNLIAGNRHKLNLTQKQLAGKMDISQNMISDYEKGKRHLTPTMAEKFEKILNIPISLILND